MKLQVYFCLKCMRLIGNKPLIDMDNNFSKQAKSFLEVKLQRLRRQTYEGKYMIPVIRIYPLANSSVYYSRDRRHDIECKKETRSQ